MTFGSNKNRCVDKEDHDGVGDGGVGEPKQARKKMHLESFFSTLENPFRFFARAPSTIKLPLFPAGGGAGAIKPLEFGHGMAHGAMAPFPRLIA